jgi:hypothetical protein
LAQRGTNYGAGYVQVLTSAGAFVDTFGGGTQYADGAVQATPTGTVSMGTDGSNIFAVHTDTAGDLQVDVLSIAAGDNNIGNVDIVTRPVATPNKTAANSLVAIQTLASGAVVKSSAINVAGKFGMAVGVHLGRTATTALTNPVKVRFEFSTEDSLDSNWYPIGDLISDTLASTTTATLTTATTAGTATLPMTATAGILIGDGVLIYDATIGNSEWGRVITVNTNTSVVIEDNTLRNHAITTTQVWSKANIWSFVIDVSRYTRVRCVFDAAYALSGQTVVCEARYTLLDSIT